MPRLPTGTAPARHPTPRTTSHAALIPAIDLWPFAPDGYAMRNALFPPKHERDMKTNPSIVDVFWGHLCLGTSKSTDTVRGHCMRVLGELAHHFPVEVSAEHVYERGLLYDRCVNVLKADVMPGNPKTWLLSGALVGIGGLLQARRRAPTHPSAGGRPPPPLPPALCPPP